MRIAINAASLSKSNFDIFFTLAKAHPGETFYFFLEKESSFSPFSSNIQQVIIYSKKEARLNRNRWFTIKIKRALKKIEADIFISEKAVILNSKIRQILLSPELSYFFYAAGLNEKEKQYYQKNNGAFCKTAVEIMVNSFFIQKEIVEKFQVPAEKIHVIYPSINTLFTAPINNGREIIKEKYANGNEYFIYKGPVGNQENLMNLLKAFSFFKKRQRSKMQLVIMGSPAAGYENFLESVRLFRFKEEVKIITDISSDESEQILSSAYAMVFVPMFKSDPAEVAEAIRCQIPLIVSSTGILKEYCGEAALFADPGDFKNIAEQMMYLFKDEQKRKELIEKGKLEKQKFIKDNPEEILWEIIKSTIEK